MKRRLATAHGISIIERYIVALLKVRLLAGMAERSGTEFVARSIRAAIIV